MRVLARMFLATIFFVLVAAAVITILEAPTAPSTEEEAAASPASDRSSIDRNATETASTPRVGSAVGGPSLQPVVAPSIGALPPAEIIEPTRRNRLTASTPVYLTSSANAGVLTELSNDDLFETGVSVLNEDGLWLEVRLDRSTYGFVRGDDLDIN